jgi:hypothetical protein
MKSRLIALAIVAVPFAAFAQSDPMQMARLGSANEVGVMEYCQGKGWADQAAVDAVKTSFASLPPGGDASATASAEATGKSGSLLNNGTAMPLSSMATQSNSSEQALCGKMMNAVKMASAQQKAMPSAGGAMPAMPAMPGGMSMPAMPAAPAAQ